MDLRSNDYCWNSNKEDTLLSSGLRLVMNSHHRKDGKWLIDEGSIDCVTKTEQMSLPVFPVVILQTAYIAGRLKKGIYTKVKPCFFTKSVRFVRAELTSFFPESSSQGLQCGHGFRACSFRNTGNKFNFHTFGDEKTEQMKKFDEICQI